MNKFILITLFIAVVAAQIDFESMKGMNPIECLQKAATFLSDAKTFIDQVKSDPIDVASDVREIKKLFADLKEVLPKCGLKRDIQPYIVDIIEISDSSQCIAGIEALVSVVSKVVDDIKNKDLSSLIGDVQTLVSQIETTLAACQGKSIQNSQRLLQATNTSINATDCMVRATKFVSTLQTIIQVNGSQPFDIDIVIHGLHNTFLSSYNMMHQSCGTHNVGVWLNSTLPSGCITSLRDAAIHGHAATNQMKTNMWGALNAMSTALSSWDKAHILCPFIQTSTPTLKLAHVSE